MKVSVMPTRPIHKVAGVGSDSSSSANGMMARPPKSNSVPVHK